MAILWKTVDRLGRPVVLTDEGWTHILFEHDSMAHRIHEVRDAVAFADEVVHDRTFAHREIHYRERGSGKSWLRVIVHYRPRDPSGWAGEVITAHIINRRSRKESPRWP